MNRRLGMNLTILVVAGGLLLAGCAPQTPQGGRIDPYATTPSDIRSTSVNLPALLEFSDVAAQQLALELTQIPEIRNAQTRAVLEIGSIENRTHTATSDFRQIQRRLRSNLMRSDVIRNHFVVVESVQRMDEELARVTGDPALPRSDRYDPNLIYVLQADFFESVRGPDRRYFFNFKLVNLQSRVIVFDENMDFGQTTGR